jgi:hypothetical protein
LPDVVDGTSRNKEEEPAVGKFTIMRDGHGIPIKFWARERQSVIWPPFLKLRKYSKERRYERDLRTKNVHVSNSIIGIIGERSKAGEELRLLALCSMAMMVTVGAVAFSW